MFRVLSASLVITAGLTIPVSGQQRPNFSGDWTLVAESSTPESQSALGGRARIAHQPGELALELPLWFLSQDASAVETGEFDAPKRYRLDGAEYPMAGQRPTSIRNPDGSPRGSLMPSWPTAGRYRATWTGEKLVILSHDQLPVLNGGAFQFVALTIRTAFSLSPEGSLVVERVSIREPLPGPREQPAPVTMRSVYRRAR